MRPRDPEKERRILRATLDAVAAGGLTGLSMDAVAKAARVASGTLYIYFESKEALIDALYFETKQAFARAIVAGVDAKGPIRIAFQQMCLGYMRYVAQHRAERVFLQQLRESPLVRKETRERAEALAQPVVDLLARGQAEGLVKVMPIPLMLAFVDASLTETASRIAGEPPARREEQFELLARLAWDALKA